MAGASPTEREPLLGSQDRDRTQAGRTKKPFFRPRPLWLVPFALVASIVRGMTLAPRVQVFTQLSCNIVYGNDIYDHTTFSSNFTIEPRSPYDISIPFLESFGPHLDVTSYISTITQDTSPAHALAFSDNSSEGNDEGNPRALPNCSKDPAVQATAARLQTIMAMTVGTLCALSTGWWGHYGERHGRTRVLAAATAGLFITDLTFILVSTPHSIFAAHGQLLLVIAPIIEGILGGWSTLQGATSAYVSDCTSDGSRAHVFSRFSGVFFLGLSIGPTLGALLIRHPIFHNNPAADMGHNVPEVISVFYVAAMCSFVNLLLVLFVFPESLDKKKAKQAALMAQQVASGMVPSDTSVVNTYTASHLERLLSPLGLFIPKKIPLPGGGTRRDWSLTILASALFMFLLSSGIFQLKYLYAEHVYGWGAEQLSYYISLMGAVRALNLLVIMPFLISRFKPVSEVIANSLPATAAASLTRVIGKPKPTLAHLRAEMSFDLILVRTSLFIDFCSHFFVFLSPASAGPALFVVFTSMSSLGAGVHPAVNSIALCLLQIRQYAIDEASETAVTTPQDDGGAGRLFGSLSVLQALGQYILGPMMFGLIYGTTVAHFPKTIFITAAGIICFAIALIFVLRPEQQYKPLKHDAERGRSRARKDISVGSPASHSTGHGGEDVGEEGSSSSGSSTL